ncbi:MAG: hypothetical protein ACI837_000980 [Crocinitomicaceae bacterium]|jgi:hypothetical protein
MKKSYLLLPCLAVASMGFFAFQSAESNNGDVKSFVESHLQNGGGQSGLTGAPGEQNCTSCHVGTVIPSSSENTFVLLDVLMNPVTTYMPGVTYTASISMVSNPDKKGFSAVALDGTDLNAGSFTGAGIGGTQDFNSGGRDYVSHTLTSNTSATTVWLWTWVAPATNVGDVTFYVASNLTNNNNSPSGDLIHLSEHVVGTTAGINETSIENSFSAGYSNSNNSVMVDFTYLAAGDMRFDLVDMNGRSVFTSGLGQSEIGENSEAIQLPSHVEDGMYVVHFFVGNKAMSANIMVKK